MKEAQADTVVSGRLPSPLLIDKFLQDAVEIDVDALFDGEELYIGGIMEHVEEAGVHSGDAACTLPPSTLSDDQIRRLREGTYAIAKGCGVQGLINVQYAFMANTLYVIEANPRASRTVPFASKATGVALAKAAARIMVGETIQQQRDNGLLLPHGDGGDIHRGQQVAVKESVLPFKRFRTPLGKTVDVLLGPEMRSTGEVMGFDRDFPHAFAKSQLAAYEGGLPTSGNVFISVNDTDKRQLPLFAARLVELGFNIWATEGTASVLRRYGIDSKIVDKISVRMDSDPDDPITTYHAEGSVGKNVVQLIEEGAIPPRHLKHSRTPFGARPGKPIAQARRRDLLCQRQIGQRPALPEMRLRPEPEGAFLAPRRRRQHEGGETTRDAIKLACDHGRAPVNQ